MNNYAESFHTHGISDPAADFDADHICHRFSSVGYEVHVAYDPFDNDGGAWWTYNAGMVSADNVDLRSHESQAHAIAFAANQVLQDVDNEVGETSPRLEVIK